MRKTFVSRKGFSITELEIASVIAILIFAAAIGAFLLVKNIQNYSGAELALERDVGTVMARLIRNIGEAADSRGLRSGRSFIIPSAGELAYTDVDGNTRRYYLSGSSIFYASPLQSPQTGTIFTAPSGTSVILRFWKPSGYSDNETVGIYIGLVKNIGGRAVSGSVSTYVNLRNVAK